MRKNPTAAEKHARSILESFGVRFKFQKVCFRKHKYRIFDFYLPRLKLAIEIDGGYHDEYKDKLRDEDFLRARPAFKILRFTNEEIFMDGQNLLAAAIFFRNLEGRKKTKWREKWLPQTTKRKQLRAERESFRVFR